MRQSMSDIYSDLAEKDEESEISDGGEHELCVVCFEERTLEDLPCGHRYCKQVGILFFFNFEKNYLL